MYHEGGGWRKSENFVKKLALRACLLKYFRKKMSTAANEKVPPLPPALLITLVQVHLPYAVLSAQGDKEIDLDRKSASFAVSSPRWIFYQLCPVISLPKFKNLQLFVKKNYLDKLLQE